MLLCPSDGRSCGDVNLPDGVRIVLGRGPQTKIADKKCSREHLALTANVDRQSVLVEQIGPNPSQIKGNMSEGGTRLLHPGESAILDLRNGPAASGYSISFLEGKFAYTVQAPRQISGALGPSSNEQASFTSVEEARTGAAKRKAATNLDAFFELKSKKLPSDVGAGFGSAASPLHAKAAIGGDENEGDSDISAKLKVYQDKMRGVEQRKAKAGEGEKGEDVGVAKTTSAEEGSSPESAQASADCKGAAAAAAAAADHRSVQPKTGTKGIASGWAQPSSHLHVYSVSGIDGNSVSKVAGFDLDSTLIATASGKKWPQDKDDWKLLYPFIPVRLKQLHQDGYTLVVFTNQHGLARGTLSIHDYKHKIEAIARKIAAPLLVLGASGHDIYRKPAPGMWNYLRDQAAAGDLSPAQCFYVGDAAGRPDGWATKKKKDFACTDRLFALNVGLPFYTPEEFFCHEARAPFSLPTFSPAAMVRRRAEDTPMLTRIAGGKGEAAATLAAGECELVVLVGYAASGKSHFARTHLAAVGYVIVNRDTLGTWQKCVRTCDEALETGKSVVVDNTNLDVASREKYVACARKHAVPCRCFVFDVGHEQALHHERFRQLTDSTHAHISEMLMNMQKSKLVEPQLAEGFAEIVRVHFLPSFASLEQERLYEMYLV